MWIKIDNNEWIELLILYLLNELRNSDHSEYSDLGQEFFKVLEKKGLQSELRKLFFDVSRQGRLNFNKVRDSWESIGKKSIIEIERKKDEL